MGESTSAPWRQRQCVWQARQEGMSRLTVGPDKSRKPRNGGFAPLPPRCQGYHGTC